jgi:BNR repeat-like domain
MGRINRMPRLTRRLSAIVSVVAIVALVVGAAAVYGPLRASADPDARSAGEVADKGGAEEAEEQAETTEKRNAAFAEARRKGTSGQVRPAAAPAAAGWVGEFPFDTVWDDWEPAIAADPKAPYVYVLVTRYGAPKPCPGNCPTPYIVLEISADNGATWSEGKPLCACKGSGQFDPIIEVVPSTGHVYALYMNGFNVLFTKSTDHGQTWSAPVPTWGNVSWNDKPVLAVSDDGNHVYVSWNGPTGGDPWATVSHDAGATWTQRKLVNSGEYFFAFDADVAPDGTAYFSESALTYSSAGNGSAVTGTINHHVFISRDGGASWEDKLVASVAPGVVCDAAGCGPDFYVGHTALSSDAAGGVVLLYDGATTEGGLQRTYAKRSSNAGVSWSAAVAISRSGENSTAPAVESGASGDVRAFYYETSGGGNDDAWNVWYRSSVDGGATWTAPLKISDAPGGAAYKTPAGFLEVYGDYGEIAITNAGKAIGTWGEGISWTGPGGAWINIQR